MGKIAKLKAARKAAAIERTSGRDVTALADPGHSSAATVERAQDDPRALRLVAGNVSGCAVVFEVRGEKGSPCVNLAALPRDLDLDGVFGDELAAPPLSSISWAIPLHRVGDELAGVLDVYAPVQSDRPIWRPQVPVKVSFESDFEEWLINVGEYGDWAEGHILLGEGIKWDSCGCESVDFVITKFLSLPDETARILAALPLRIGKADRERAEDEERDRRYAAEEAEEAEEERQFEADLAADEAEESA